MRALRRPLGLTAVCASAFGLLGWSLGIGRLRDNSLLWHLRTGELILDEGIPRADPYSYTAAGTRWVAQSWLAELAYGLADRAVGPFGVRLLAAVAAAAIAILAFLLARRVCGDDLRAAGLTLVALGGLVVSFSARPLLFGILLLVVLVWTVELPASALGRHELVAVPLVLWVWVNVHGTWVLGFAYLGLHLAGRWLEGSVPWVGRDRRLLVGGAVAAALAFVNPYGWRLVTFPLGLVGTGSNLRRVAEWSSPDIAAPEGMALAAWLAVLLVVVGRRGVGRRDLLVTVPFVLMALWATRNAALLPFVTLPVAARAVAAPVGRGPGFAPSTALCAALVAFLGLAGAGVTLAAAGQDHLDLGRYPVAALAAAEPHVSPEGRLLTTDRAAGYVILEQWPERRVFFDDRVDMYPEAITDAYLALHDGRPEWAEVLDEHGVTTVVWPRERPLASLLDGSADWERVDEAGDDGVWVRP